MAVNYNSIIKGTRPVNALGIAELDLLRKVELYVDNEIRKGFEKGLTEIRIPEKYTNFEVDVYDNLPITVIPVHTRAIMTVELKRRFMTVDWAVTYMKENGVSYFVLNGLVNKK